MRRLVPLELVLVVAAVALGFPAAAQMPAPMPHTGPPEPDPCRDAPPPGCRIFTQKELRNYEDMLLRIARAVPTPRGWRRTPQSELHAANLAMAVPYPGGGSFPDDASMTLDFERGDRDVSIEIHIDVGQLAYDGRIIAREGDGFFVEQVTWGKVTDASIVTFHTPPGGRRAHLRSVSIWVTGERRDVEAVARTIDHAAVFKLLREELERSRAARPGIAR